MKYIVLIAVIMSFSFITSAQDKYGTELTLKEKTSIADILESPQDYVGKKVLVEGKVVDVCEMAGCWMDIAGSSPAEKIKIKVKDGEIEFPVEARGSLALVEGEVYATDFTQEEAVAYYSHMAEDAGKEFDESTITGPVTIYQIKGLGAVISPAPGPEKVMPEKSIN